jgi:hypothetical protein
MSGKYIIDGVVVNNIVTTNGKISLLNSIAGKKSGFASSIMVGIGSTAASINDTSLQFLVGGASLATTIVDPVNETIYFKTNLASADQYIVYELGCYPSNMDASKLGALLIVFGSNTQWTDLIGSSTLDLTNGRIGSGAIRYDIAASATGSGTAPLNIDLSGLDATTSIKLAYYVNNMTSVTLKLKMDSSNYFYYSYPVGSGYLINSANKSAFSSTGSPDWSKISSLEVVAIANSSGGFVVFDACRYDTPQGNQAGGLLSRAVLGTPQAKFAGVTSDVEYILEVTI